MGIKCNKYNVVNTSAGSEPVNSSSILKKFTRRLLFTAGHKFENMQLRQYT